MPSVQDLLPSDENMHAPLTDKELEMDSKKGDPAQQSKRKKELKNCGENKQGFYVCY